MEIQINYEIKINNLLNKYYRNIVGAAKEKEPTTFWDLDELYKIAYIHVYYWKYK